MRIEFNELGDEEEKRYDPWVFEDPFISDLTAVWL